MSSLIICSAPRARIETPHQHGRRWKQPDTAGQEPKGQNNKKYAQRHRTVPKAAAQKIRGVLEPLTYHWETPDLEYHIAPRARIGSLAISTRQSANEKRQPAVNRVRKACIGKTRRHCIDMICSHPEKWRQKINDHKEDSKRSGSTRL